MEIEGPWRCELRKVLGTSILLLFYIQMVISVNITFLSFLETRLLRCSLRIENDCTNSIDLSAAYDTV